MRTAYIPHIFGEEVQRKLRSRIGWLTAGVASSIPWPSFDVCVKYAGDEYFLRGTKQHERPTPPCITVACNGSDEDNAIAKIYKFTSILSWFDGGYVDVSGYIWGTHPILYGGRSAHSSMGLAGDKSFNCNHMPIIEQENIWKALAFWREGERLHKVHDSYAFLSFFKVIESQFSNSNDRINWITANIDILTGEAAQRALELQSNEIDVGRHLYESGRCAVAHASLNGNVVDPDNPEDRKRLSSDLAIIKELAKIYIRDELEIPTSRSLYTDRNRLEPWFPLFQPESLALLKNGGIPDDLSGLENLIVSIGLWPDGHIPNLEKMTMNITDANEGVIKISLTNERKTISIIFVLDFPNGKLHTILDEGGLRSDTAAPNEEDIKAYATFFYMVLANKVAELTYENFEPINCEIVIPENIIMTTTPEQAIEEEIARFQKRKNESNNFPANMGEWAYDVRRIGSNFQGYGSYKNERGVVTTIYGFFCSNKSEALEKIRNLTLKISGRLN